MEWYLDLSPDYLEPSQKGSSVESARRIKRAGGTSREMGGRCAMMPLALLLLPHAALASCDSVGKFVPLDFNTSLVRSNLGGVGGRCSSVERTAVTVLHGDTTLTSAIRTGRTCYFVQASLE